MDFLHIIPLVLGLIYFSIFFGILYLVYKWVNTFIALRREQNELLREIIRKMGELR
ncbi:hypothetical protein ADIS_4443 [Lunatimonas lonarensis]|uniref:DUF4083 domain-containing protein n=1 Tax=Lunatimonas lonarensis TaxID=1232681 RepID=R7ZMG5_9BACT|nr:hypothetical protein [Lunatimonas lonarensis]EON75272.1 hypothetical protein ADIS_4443 [Lunatimonas lonarensis]